MFFELHSKSLSLLNLSLKFISGIMKKIFLLLTISLFTLSLFSQTINPTLTKDYYLQKSRKQNKTASILLAGGTLMAVLGALSFNTSYDSGSHSSTDTSGFILLGGVLADLISIPFFISSAKNARMAASISFEPQKLVFSKRNIFIEKPQLSFTLRIGL